MTSYRGQVEGILSLGPNIWSAEYKFREHDRATAVAQIVAAGVPEIVKVSQDKHANIVVGEVGDTFLLFIGGLISNEAFTIAHTFATSGGGEFLHGSMPGGKAMLSEASLAELKLIGAEPGPPEPSESVLPRTTEPTAFDRLVADIEANPEQYAGPKEPNGPAPRNKPWWRFWA